MRALGVVLCACVRYSCKLSFYCDCLLTFIRLDTPEYTEPRSTPSMSLSVNKLIEEGGEPGRLLTGHLFAVNVSHQCWAKMKTHTTNDPLALRRELCDYTP